jgi:hypothetical protein
MFDFRVFPLALLGFATAVLPAVAQDFRMETEVYTDRGQEPTSESLTLFRGDVVYDFLLVPHVETTVLDIRRGKLILLDPQREVRTSLTVEQLAEFSAAIKVRGTSQGPAHLFQPQFTTTFDELQTRLTLESEKLTYSVKAVSARHATGAQRYRQFADWYARLNAIRPENLPPFGRLELNQALAERGLLPLEIERSLVLDRRVADKKLHARSKHAVTWLISGTDQGRIELTGQQLTKFREVSPAEYWADPVQTAKSK